MDEGGAGYGCVAVIVFFAVWIGCTIAFGPLGFMLGWMPALILAFIWPLVAALGVVAVVILAILIAIVLYLASQASAPA